MAIDEPLFHIECYVDSTKLGKVLMLLAGNVRQMSTPKPVIGAQRKGNGVAAKGSDLADLFGVWIAQQKLAVVTSVDARRFLEEHGRSPSSFSYLFNLAKRCGVLKFKQTGKYATMGHWLVVKKRDYAAEHAKRKAAAAKAAEHAKRKAVAAKKA